MIPYEVKDNLPSTCFIFTKPLLEELHLGGKQLHQNIINMFLKYYLEIICFSFDSSNENFKTFILTFKEICLKMFDHIRTNHFDKLLHEIVSQFQRRTPTYFQNLDKATVIIKRADQLIYDKKIT